MGLLVENQVFALVKSFEKCMDGKVLQSNTFSTSPTSAVGLLDGQFLDRVKSFEKCTLAKCCNGTVSAEVGWLLEKPEYKKNGKKSRQCPP